VAVGPPVPATPADVVGRMDSRERADSGAARRGARVHRPRHLPASRSPSWSVHQPTPSGPITSVGESSSTCRSGRGRTGGRAEGVDGVTGAPMGPDSPGQLRGSNASANDAEDAALGGVRLDRLSAVPVGGNVVDGRDRRGRACPGSAEGSVGFVGRGASNARGGMAAGGAAVGGTSGGGGPNAGNDSNVGGTRGVRFGSGGGPVPVGPVPVAAVSAGAAGARFAARSAAASGGSCPAGSRRAASRPAGSRPATRPSCVGSCPGLATNQG